MRTWWTYATDFFKDTMRSLRELSARKRFRIILRSISIIGGVVAAYVASVLVQKLHFWWGALPTGILLLATLVEFILADIITEARFPSSTQGLLDRLDRNLAPLHEEIRARMQELIDTLRGCDRGRVSATLHLAVDIHSSVDDRQEPAFLQITSYTGRLGGMRWRCTPATKGLVGRCLRERRPLHVNFKSADDYSERMVGEFGYEPSEVARHTRQARSYWTQPVFVDERFIGVLFLFSTESQVFPHAMETLAAERTANQIAGLLAATHIV